MNIVIVGAGKVGNILASHLLAEGHEITIVDSNERVLTNIGNTMDVIGYCGNGASYATLRDVGVDKADLLIAATASDEVNMLCCLAAHKLGAGHTIARVRDPEYSEQCGILREELGLSMAINPELAAAREIARILRFPAATRVELFAGGRVELVACRVKAESPLVGTALRDLPKKAGLKVLICVAERNGDILIPSGSFVPQEDDVLYFTGAANEMIHAFKKINLSTSRARTVMIVGGGRITYYLASALEKEGVDIKIVERDPARAEELSALLPKSVILVGDVTNHELLLEEGMESVDAFVALTGLDEGNILAAIYASHHNARKVIAKVNNEDLIPLMRDTALETIVSPKRITVNQILRYVRALDAGDDDTNVQSLYKIIGSRVEVLEFRADPDGEYLNRTLNDLPIKQGILIACIIREGKVLIPDGTTQIFPMDGVLVVTSGKPIHALSDILE